MRSDKDETLDDIEAKLRDEAAHYRERYNRNGEKDKVACDFIGDQCAWWAERIRNARRREEEAKAPDYIVQLPDLAGKTYPAIVFKRIAQAADLLMENGWTSLVTDGFVLRSGYLLKGGNVVQVREVAEMLPKHAVLDRLHELGGCDSENGTWADGWDKAIDQAYNDVEQMEGVQA